MSVNVATMGSVARKLTLSAGLMVSLASIAVAETKINVVTSIKPVHSLVASVMDGVGEPGLIVDGAGSPHAYALKPSQAEALQNADVVFWIGHELEAFLEKPLETLGKDARNVELMDAKGLTKLKQREGGAFEAHEHDDDKHGDEHDAHAETKDDDHDDHHDALNAHIWLDPINAKAMIETISETLVAVDPKNATAYRANAKTAAARLEVLVANVRKIVAPVKGRGYIVFHDAYHYFEERVGLRASGAIAINPEVAPGAARIAEIQGKVRELGATCVFAEPQFEPRVVKVVTEGTKAKPGVLDPLGTELTNGPDLYFDLIRNLGQSYAGCLADAT